jgi:hypothetical protein
MHDADTKFTKEFDGSFHIACIDCRRHSVDGGRAWLHGT